jgi:hypothetical protein
VPISVAGKTGAEPSAISRTPANAGSKTRFPRPVQTATLSQELNLNKGIELQALSDLLKSDLTLPEKFALLKYYSQ